jgi:hypothetical protein
MKHILTLIALLLLTFTAAAQSKPVINTITPDSGPAAGGTEIVITGDNFSTKVNCILPCPPIVSFGDIEVEAIDESDERLVVVTPPHPPATVDVSVSVAGEDPVTKPDAFTFIGGPESQYELVLFPVNLDGPVNGAFGTRWMTDLWIRNNGGEAVNLAPWPCPPGEACPAVVPLTHSLQAGFSLHNLPPFFQAPDGNPSRLLYVAKPGASEVSFGLRFADLTSMELNSGTDLPVIRESELLRRESQLFNVPLTDPKFRVLLRVYDTAHTTSRFRMTLSAQAEGAQAQVHAEEITASTTQTGDFRTKAAYAQFDVTDLLRLEKTWPAAVRITVEPLTAGSRYWTFASITNNETQLVTLATPQ